MFLYSVDGVHCRINELVHPTLARNDKLYSHKFHQAGLAYELALSIQDHGLVWMRGPFVASKHDATIFRQELKQKTPLGKKGIGDQGYRGEKAYYALQIQWITRPFVSLRYVSQSRNAAYEFLVTTAAHACLP